MEFSESWYSLPNYQPTRSLFDKISDGKISSFDGSLILADHIEEPREDHVDVPVVTIGRVVYAADDGGSGSITKQTSDDRLELFYRKLH